MFVKNIIKNHQRLYLTKSVKGMTFHQPAVRLAHIGKRDFSAFRVTLCREMKGTD